jgi:hypothetical protein
MLTLAKLLEEREILRIEVELDERELPSRLLYGTPGFIAWLDERLRKFEPSPLGADLAPAEQLDLLFYEFTSGAPLSPTRQFRVVRHEKFPVWELKTPDLRVFGWFARKDCFIAAFGDWADNIKDHGLYRGYRLEVRRLRRRLGAEPDLCVEGEIPGDVVSL